jgi:hypothetical protein
MLLIVFNWLIVLYISYMHGFVLCRLLLSQTERLLNSIILFWGFALLSLTTITILFFKNVSWVELLIYFFLSLVVHVRFGKSILNNIKPFLDQLRSGRTWVFLMLMLLGVLVFSSQASQISDDGLYYTPTIRWLNEVGFVKGISNLNLGLGLTSSWHVLQALFSMNFIEGVNFNDLNGILVIVLVIYWIEVKADAQHKLWLACIIGLTIILSIPFLNACSPDLSVMVCTVIAFHIVSDIKSNEQWKHLMMLAVLGFGIKFSAIALILLGSFAFLFLFYYRNSIEKFLAFTLFSVVSIAVVLANNFYLTG